MKHNMDSIILQPQISKSLLNIISGELEDYRVSQSVTASSLPHYVIRVNERMRALAQVLSHSLAVAPADLFDVISVHTMQLSDLLRLCRRVLDVSKHKCDGVAAYLTKSEDGFHVIVLSPCAGWSPCEGGMVAFSARLGIGVRSIFSESRLLIIVSAR